ncbi:MAG: alpha-amylase family protein [Halanaerobiaceae bacterium]
MSKKDLRFRQIHLDFHTGKDIPGIGAKFNPEEFVKTLKKARVNSITCFARGHHGWLYYDSKKFPERIHPNLKDKDLLKKQIEICHQNNIKVPIYITVQWDLYTAQRHPEWRVIGPEGKLSGTPPYEAGFYQDLCVNTPYRDFLKEQTEEVLETLPVDGIFFDIVQINDCSCTYCQEGMRKKDLNPARKEDRLKYAEEMIAEFKLEMSEFVRDFEPEATIFYNAGHIGPHVKKSKSAYSHFELESLPTGGWGYVHFPISVRYARSLGKDCLGMTGKFHTSWGDFHSFKTKEALEYECFRMLALNAKCSIGDQLPPEGRLSEPVYDLIGSVYSEVEIKEPWCKEAEPVTQIGVLNPEEFTEERVPAAAAGVVRILEQGSHQFNIIDTEAELSDYELLILPDNILIDEEFYLKLEKYLENGGKLIASFESGMDQNQTEIKLKQLGIKLKTEQTLTESGKLAAGKDFSGNAYAEYLLPGEKIGQGLPVTEHVMYKKGLEIEKEDKNTEVLAEVISSYFNRTWEHFCSHNQTPSSGKVDYPGIVKNKNCIYFAHPIFTQYNQNAPAWCKKLILNSIDLLLEEPLLTHNGPSTLTTTINEQKNKNRWIIHLLHYIPERKSEDIDIIEDIIPLYNLEISLLIPSNKNVEKVVKVPGGKILDYETGDNRIKFRVSQISGHEMIEVSYN